LSRFDSIILGDNPFFGVDHLSHERSRLRSNKYKTFENAIDVIKRAKSFGINEIMVGTRPLLNEFFKAIKQKTDFFDQIYFHATLPYSQGYVLKLNEKGLMNTIHETLRAGGLKNELKIIAKGGLGYLKKDLYDLFEVFLDVEMLKLYKVNLKTIYLHPLVTDLALALDMKKIFERFQNHLHDSYGLNVGLCTNNFSALVNRLNEWDLNYQHIMTSFNAAGFFMNPSRKECERSLQLFKGKVLAMNILAGGYFSLQESFDYIQSLPQIRNIVVGVSTVSHAEETFKLLTEA